MLQRLLSHDLPRSPWLSLALLAVLVVLAFAPFLFEGPYGVIVAVKPLALQGKKHRPFRCIAGVRGDGTCMLYCFSQVSG